MMSHSIRLFKKAQTLIPGGVNSPVRSFQHVNGEPVFFQKGKGPYLFDVDNNQYIDYVGSWGPMILGHAHPAVLEAVHQAVEQGFSFGAPTPIEVEMAATITRLMPNIELIRMVNSGTEATQTAIRLARGYTQRNKIIKFIGCYHGHVDSLLVKAGSGALTLGQPNSAGVPADTVHHTLLAEYNDLGAVEALFKQYGADIAAIIVEPIAGNMNCILPHPHFLSGLRHLTTQYGSVFIMDEVMTGFRVALGGAQALYAITPDLTCLGKVIGGGFPVGAVGGKREIMEYLAPLGPVYQAGTLSGNPIALAAGLATLQELEKPGIYTQLNAYTEYFRTHSMALAQQFNVPLQVTAVCGMFGLFFTENLQITNLQMAQACNTQQFNLFFHDMLKQGVYFAPSAFEAGFISLAHTQAIIDLSLEKMETVFATWKTKHPSTILKHTYLE